MPEPSESGLTEDDVTEVMKAAEEVYDGWFADVQIDWENFIDRLDGMTLESGQVLDMGTSMDSPLIRKIKAHIRSYRKL